MKYIQRLVNQIRKETENEESSAFTGITDSEFIQYLNDAQYHLQALITAQHPRVFVEEGIISTVKDQERYDLPEDILLENKVHSVEYSTDGKDYYNISQTNMKNRSDINETGYPSNYIRLSGQLLLTPIPSSSGFIRVNYIKKVKEVGLRIAAIASSTTINTSGTTTLVLDNTNFTTDVDSLRDIEYICILDRDGKPKLSNLNISVANLYNVVSGTSINLNTVDYKARDSDLNKTSLAVDSGDYLVANKNTTTHSELPPSIERYLIAYTSWKILKRDSSVDSMEMQGELAMMSQEIIASYANITDDLQNIPIINDDDWSF